MTILPGHGEGAEAWPGSWQVGLELGSDLCAGSVPHSHGTCLGREGGSGHTGWVGDHAGEGSGAPPGPWGKLGEPLPRVQAHVGHLSRAGWLDRDQDEASPGEGPFSAADRPRCPGLTAVL